MSRHIQLEAESVRTRLARGDPFWPAQLAVATAIALNMALTEKVTIGPTWLFPSIEALLLAALVIALPARATAHSAPSRRFGLAVIAFVSVANIVSLGFLVHFLVNGGKAGGHQLILSGAVLLATNILLFAVWFWELDRGGPVARFLESDALPDFQFPQLENPHLAPPGWRPGFVDYLYLSLTNATAFSPTDTLPLSRTAKIVMGLQSLTALTTVGLVVARAVNILG